MKLNLVPARAGIRWVREGVRVFLRMPLAFAGLFVMFMVAATLLSLIPLAGMVLAPALLPAAIVGMMAATRQAVEGRFPLPATLLIGFRQSPRQTRAMLALGGLCACALLLIVVIATVAAPVDQGRLTELMTRHGGHFGPELMADPALRSTARAALRQMALAGLLCLPVAVPLWHAPALVCWHDMPVGKSLFFSVVAVLRNVPAYLMYALGWLAVSSIAWAGLLIIAGMTGDPLSVAAGGMVPLGVLILSMICASLWFTFRDSFGADAAPADAPPRDAV